MRSIVTFIIILLILAFIELYSFKGLRGLTANWHPRYKITLAVIYWLIPLVLIGTAGYMFMHRAELNSDNSMRVMMFFMGLFVLVFVPKIVFTSFHLLEDVVRLISNLGSKAFPENSAPRDGLTRISRSRFLTLTGLLLAAVPFMGILYGIFKGRFDYRVSNQILRFKNLPDAFDGLRIVQISDSHVGSFLDNKTPVETALELVNKQNPDVLLFTGDMVNNRSREANNWVQSFGKLKANIQKLAILGNHDYGEYAEWENEEAKSQDVKNLVALEEQMGFKVLLNDAVRLKRHGQEIAFIGVENWGHKPFPQYGDLNKASKNVKDLPFKVLLSHDPSHWDAEVVKHTDIDLTLSGHTHGMQFGLNMPGFKWSPVKYRYPRWAGLYQEGRQYLYVNRGFGYIGFPGRVGMPPEITVIDLKKEA